MRLLDTEKMTWVWFSVWGTPPSPWMGHSINISGTSLILFGGWTNTSGNKEKKGKNQKSMDYFRVLNTNKFMWQIC